MAAGVSADYLTRLEQGRDHQPSAQVLSALARALQLDDDATAHLHALGRPAPRPERWPVRQTVSTDVADLLASWSTTPAFVSGPLSDVLASNVLARALAPCYEPGTNLLRSMFLDPESQHRHAGWDRLVAEAVAHFRAAVRHDLDDPRLADLVGELSRRSECFRALWARHDVRETVSGTQTYLHPVVGPITVRFTTLRTGGTDGQHLVVMHAPPGSADGERLALLGALAAETV